MTTLLIIESPKKRETLKSILGDGYDIRASFGHVRDLPEKALGVAAPDYRPDYVLTDRAQSTISSLAAAARTADRVLLATDPDREGEAIAWHIAQVLKLRNPERITYGSITSAAVLSAIASPRGIDLNLVRAQEARRVLDRLVGYEVSPALSNSTNQKLSAGRVQSPAVRLVVERERAIRGFAAVKHYGAQITFAPTGWRAQWQPVLPEGQQHVLDPKLGSAAASVTEVTVTAFADSEARRPPAAPFTTATLLQSAEAALKLSPKRATAAAQALYEQGAITYMRTDSPNLSDEALTDIAAYARSAGLTLVDRPRTWKAKEGAQEAHEAIRPTHVETVVAGETADEKLLYQLIRNRTLASQLPDAIYAVRRASLTGGAEPLAFEARGRALITPGWLTVYADEDDAGDSEDANDIDNPIPALTVGQVLPVASGKLQTKTTKAPKRYTEASLIKALEALQIGRPSTYAAIIENITRREYITVNAKGAISATATAETIVDHLVGHFGFVNFDYTSALEQELDDIAGGKRAYAEVLHGAHQQLQSELAGLAPSAVAHPCPDCGAPLRRRQGDRGAFWGCSTYPACKTTRPDDDGAPVERQVRPESAAAPTAAHTCPDCHKPLRRNTRTAKEDPKGRGFDFWGCTGFRDGCKRTFKPGPDGAPVFAGAGA
jgi:DNA topoisomerase-1